MMKGLSVMTPTTRKMMQVLNSCKATLFCVLVTILVLRSTAMVSDHHIGDIEGTTEWAHVGQNRHGRKLAQADEVNISEKPDPVTASKFVEEEKWDPSTPYTLGPKISNWDQQRVIWNNLNPGKNKTRNGKPKILLVSGSQPGPCANPMGDFYHLKFVKNRLDYARLHGLEFFYNMATFSKEMTSFWAKLPLLRKLMVSHPEVEWIWWMDSDAIFTDMAFEMPMEKYEGKNLVVHGFHNLLFEQHRWIGLNTGIFLIRNCQWSLDLLDAWAPFGPEGETRVNAGKMLTAKLVERPTFEADDQSALVYLMLFDDPKWKLKTHIEWEFYLHGYWKYLVYRYEELMAKSHPGFGDERWPFVTHFVGCKPCQLSVTPEVDECFLQMERAFNFADNQVLEKYGYAHRALASFKTQRIRKDTADPLGLLEERKPKPEDATASLNFQEKEFLRNKELAEQEAINQRT
ncbi:probable xyloglucan 6-xylosyltransferase 3 [Physcomitrium patens]|uniref:Uncharacterized protein n=1 Tax=Physcomitrium patens TaxID=3218 RepID=A0A2K1IYA6_PHYPA|nr:probable xyloglucan 6-xylosyltransferase 3 [Physcomitrium patens]XP_024403987.1 probable xyloglucan 6-xylosyltransferase 3 [Physcomitrium patens]PNR34258.1 hypothetical protein PHYPA_024075 [Physcomitrium patens]|eukprot:XP_024403986.1 probable xyloglucan 6-xylosyltransferase 3 [Physcomitrella patens]